MTDEQQPTEPLANEAIERLVSDEIEHLRATGQLVQGSSSRCYICRDIDTRLLVDRLLGLGWRYNAIVELLDQSVNLHRVDDKINYESVYNHRKKHFAINHPAASVYRSIVDRRQEEHDASVAVGIGTAVNHMSFLEIVQQVAYEKAVSDTPDISIGDGISAAKALAELERRDQGAGELAQKIGELSQIISAVKAEVSPEVYARIASRLRGEVPPTTELVVDEVADFDASGIATRDDGDQIDE